MTSLFVMTIFLVLTDYIMGATSSPTQSTPTKHDNMIDDVTQWTSPSLTSLPPLLTTHYGMPNTRRPTQIDGQPLTPTLSTAVTSRPPRFTIDQLIKMMSSNRMSGCVSRLTCELACNPDAFGPEGRQLFMTMRMFEEHESKAVQHIRDAGLKGRELAPQCDKCLTLFACRIKTANMVRMARRLF